MSTPNHADIFIIFSFPVLDSDYGQLSFETWTFLHDIYDGGPVYFIEGEKEIEEKQDQQEQEEEVQQEWRHNSSGQFGINNIFITWLRRLRRPNIKKSANQTAFM